MRKLALATVAVAVILTACGGDDTTAGDDTAGGGTEQQGGAATVSVQAQEYEFTGVPDTMAAGSATFQLENAGEEPHEFQLFRITTDVPIDELVAMSQQEAQENIQPVGGTFAEPGQSAQFEGTLEPGRYGYACFVPSPEGEPHAALGMFGEFTVE